MNLCIRNISRVISSHQINIRKIFTSQEIHFPELIKEKIVLGLDNRERKHLKKQIKSGSKIFPKIKHKYGFQYTWKTPTELATHLKETEIYSDKEVIVLNKPYGVAKVKITEEDGNIKRSPIISSILSGGVNDNLPCFEDTLVVLRELYNSKLELLIIPERWNSGVILLARTGSAANDILKGTKYYVATKETYKSYLTVTVGKPTGQGYYERIGIENLSGKVKLKMEYSNNSVKRQQTKPNAVSFLHINHNSNLDVSLIELNVIHTKHNFIRLYLAKQLAPALGDNLFGGRIQTVMGKKYFSTEFTAERFRLPNLKEELMEALILNRHMIVGIPTHIHLHELKCRLFGRELVFNAPPPEHFMWTCAQLQLLEDYNTSSFVNCIKNMKMKVEAELKNKKK